MYEYCRPSRLRALYASLRYIFAEVGLPHPPVIATFLEELSLSFVKRLKIFAISMFFNNNCVYLVVGRKAIRVGIFSF